MSFLFGGNVEGLVGSQFSKPVFIQNVTDVSAYEFDLTYDDSAVSVASVSVGSFLPGAGCSSSTPMGGVLHVMCSKPGGPGASGTGDIAIIDFVFDKNTSGSLLLGLSNCEASEPDGDPVALSVCKSITLTVIEGRPAMYFPFGDFKVQGLAGSTFAPEVDIEGVTNVSAWEFDLSYDETMVEVASFYQGTFIGIANCSTSTPTAGVLHAACVNPGGPGATGSGHLATITFQFLQNSSGTLELALSNCAAFEPDGDPVPIDECGSTAITVSPVPPAAPMTISPEKYIPGPHKFTVDVNVGEVTDLGGVEFEVFFDQALLDVVDMREGPFMTSEGADVVCFMDHPQDSGLIRVGCVTLGKEGSPTGSGVIAHIDFQIATPFPGDTTALVLQNCELADEQGFNIPVSECTGATVLGKGTPTPVPGSTPPPPVGGVSRGPDTEAITATDAARRSGSAASWWPALAGAAAVLLGAGAAAIVMRRRP